MNVFLKISIQTILLSWLGCTPVAETGPAPVISEADHTTPTFRGKVMQSADMGQTWTDISEGLPEDARPPAVSIADNEAYLG